MNSRVVFYFVLFAILAMPGVYGALSLVSAGATQDLTGTPPLDPNGTASVPFNLYYQLELDQPANCVMTSATKGATDVLGQIIPHQQGQRYTTIWRLDAGPGAYTFRFTCTPSCGVDGAGNTPIIPSQRCGGNENSNNCPLDCGCPNIAHAYGIDPSTGNLGCAPQCMGTIDPYTGYFKKACISPLSAGPGPNSYGNWGYVLGERCQWDGWSFSKPVCVICGDGLYFDSNTEQCTSFSPDDGICRHLQYDANGNSQQVEPKDSNDCIYTCEPPPAYDPNYCSGLGQTTWGQVKDQWWQQPGDPCMTVAGTCTYLGCSTVGYDTSGDC